MRILLVVILVAAAAESAAPQAVPPTIEVDTREVLVEVTVTNSRGAPVTGLTKQDFTLLDDGKVRVIDEVSTPHDYKAISAVPVGLPNAPASGTNSANIAMRTPSGKVGHSSAIILDEANTFFADAAQARENVMSLLNKVQPDERIALYVIVRMKGLVLLQDYTTDREALKASLARHFPTGLRPGGSFNADQPVPPYAVPPATQEEAYNMWRHNSDQARLSLQEIAQQLALVPGRKSVFWMTNAFPPYLMKELGLQIGWDKTVAALNKANVAVNTIDTRGLYRASNQVTGTVGTMRQISEATGGNTYFNRNDLDGALAEGITAARESYTLRFHLGDDERDSRTHTLTVKVDRPGVELLYRTGYNPSGGPMPTEALAERIDGKELELRAGNAIVPTLETSAQLSWMYEAANRANVLLATEVVPAGMSFRQDDAGLHGKFQVVGSLSRADGAETARFADTVNVDFKEQAQADAFQRKPWHYEHQFTAAPGTYVFHLVVGAGPEAVGKRDLPLVIDPWSGSTLGIGGIVLSTEVHAQSLGAELAAADSESRPSLVAGGKEFAPAATNRFASGQHLYFYTEVYEPALKSGSPPAMTMQVRVTDANTGETKMDSGMAGIGGYVHAGSGVVPFATALPTAKFAPGSYLLEVRAGHSSGPDTVMRTAPFEIQ